jgi:hypothetical protein
MHIDPIRATGEAMPIVQPDPLFQLILDYAGARDRFNAVEDASDKQTELDWMPLGRIRDRLTNDTPPCTTEEGAAAVLRFIAEHIEEGDIVDFHEPVVASVLAFLTKRRESWPGEVMRQLAS